MSDFFEELDPSPKPPAKPAPDSGQPPPPAPAGQPAGQGMGPGWVPGLSSGAVPMMPSNPGIRSDRPRPSASGLRNAPLPGSINQQRVNAVLQQAERLIREKRYQQAMPMVKQVLKAQPRSSLANSLASMLMLNMGKPDTAESLSKLAVEISPKTARYHIGLGMTQMALGKNEDAFKSMRQAARLEPDNLGALLYLVRICFVTERYEEALRASERTIKLAPERPDPYGNRGMVRVQIGEADAGLEDIEHAIERRPDLLIFQENAVYAAQYSEHIAKERAFEIATRTGAAIEQAAGPVLPWMVDRDPDRPLRVGFVSRDFRRHSCGYFAEALFEHLDREQIQPIVFDANGSVDDMTERFKALAHEWHQIERLSNRDAAAMIRQRKVDVLFEISGYTSGNRVQLFGYKPAPLQISYMGFPDTTGLSRVDYRLVDAHTDPEGQTFASEQLVRLPGCFLCYRPHDKAPIPGLRKPDAPFTFGSFNDFKKFTPGTYETWTRVVNAVPGSRLLLKSRSYNDPWIKAKVIENFVAHGLDTDRLEVVGRIDDPAGHLALYDRMDIALETMPYHGTTTTCEAMWMGVPVVTMAGDRHRSRVGVSLLNAVGLPELIAESPDEYVRICTELANDRGRLAEIRGGMRERMAESSLVDGPGFCRGFESTLRDLWRQWCASGEDHTKYASPAAPGGVDAGSSGVDATDDFFGASEA